MLGNSAGEVSGSPYEVKEVEYKKTGVPYEKRTKILDPNTPLYTEDCSYTDDTSLTCAIADLLLTKGSSNLSVADYEKFIRKYGEYELNLGLDKFGRKRFGPKEVIWLTDKNTQGNSLSNGSAMRVAPIAYYFNTLKEVMYQAGLSSMPDHNHPDAITGAKAVAVSIFLARQNQSIAEKKEKIKRFVEGNFDYNLNYDLTDLQYNNRFTSKSIITVPQAIFCFLESTGFEDALRKSLSIGGDSDTIAGMTCAIAEAAYGIPDSIVEEVIKFLPDNYLNIMRQFYEYIGEPIKVLGSRR